MELRDYGRALTVPTPEGDDDLELGPTSLPAVPTVLTGAGLSACIGRHEWGGSSGPSVSPLVSLSGDEASIRGLGLVLLAQALRGDPQDVRVRLTRQEREDGGVSPAELRVVAPVTRLYGAVMAPTAFSYVPGQVRKHPWYGQDVPDPRGFPFVGIGNADGFAPRDGEPRVLFGFGGSLGLGHEGVFRLATLLLDLSQPGNARREVALEGELGFRGVAPGSAELRIWLPGGIGYWG